MIFRNYNAGAKTITGGVAQTVVWNSSDIPGTGVVQYAVSLTGAANDYANVARLRVKAAGQTIWDVLPVHMAAMLQRMSRNNLGAIAADTNFVIPLYKLDYGDNEALAYVGGFPRGLAPTVEVDVDAATAAGTAVAGWTQSDQPFSFYAKMIGSQTNIGVGVVNGRVPLTQDGLIRAFSINTTGLVRLKLKVSGVELLNLSVAQLIATQRPQNDVAVQSNPLCVVLEFPMSAVGGDSYYELDTDGAWGGTTNEITTYSILPNT